MRIARAIDSMPQLRRQLVPTVRSRGDAGAISAQGLTNQRKGFRGSTYSPVSRTRRHRYPHLRFR